MKWKITLLPDNRVNASSVIFMFRAVFYSLSKYEID